MVNGGEVKTEKYVIKVGNMYIHKANPQEIQLTKDVDNAYSISPEYHKNNGDLEKHISMIYKFVANSGFYPVVHKIVKIVEERSYELKMGSFMDDSGKVEYKISYN